MEFQWNMMSVFCSFLFFLSFFLYLFTWQRCPPEPSGDPGCTPVRRHQTSAGRGLCRLPASGQSGWGRFGQGKFDPSMDKRSNWETALESVRPGFDPNSSEAWSFRALILWLLPITVFLNLFIYAYFTWCVVRFVICLETWFNCMYFSMCSAGCITHLHVQGHRGRCPQPQWGSWARPRNRLWGCAHHDTRARRSHVRRWHGQERPRPTRHWLRCHRRYSGWVSRSTNVPKSRLEAS